MEGAEVVRLGAVPHPDPNDPSGLFAHNCHTAHRVFEEAGRAGVRRIAAASSLSALGLAWSLVPVTPVYVPIDEEHPTLVRDSYGLSKLVLEEVARTAHRLWDMDVVCMRFPFTGSGARMERQLAAVAADPGAHRYELWGWLDTRDAAAALRRAVEVDVRGCHVINVAAPDTSSPLTSAELMDTYHPGVPAFLPLADHTSLYDTSACERLLGFVPRHGWRRSAGRGGADGTG